MQHPVHKKYAVR